MASNLSRRDFVKSSLLATAAIPLGIQASAGAEAAPAVPGPAPGLMPQGKIAGQDFSRLMMGGNLIAGWSHSRDLPYVSTLMRRYNTPAKIRETLEMGESAGITAINSWVQDDNTQIFDHWKAGGKMKWFAQARLDSDGGYTQFRKAVDQGAVGIHVTGDVAESLINRGMYEEVAKTVEYVKTQKRIAGVAAHDLSVIIECEKHKLGVDFYQKTFHTHEYFTAPKPDDKSAVGANDNSWCSDPQAVVDVFSKVSKPWIAFKILAAGAIPPRAAFPNAFNSGADFILVGMFDWQIADNAELAKRVLRVVSGPNSKRTRAWC